MKKIILISITVIFLAAILRLLRLNSLPIFADESIYIRWAQIMKVEPGLRFLPLHDGKQPLYMWALIPFFKIISDPLLAGRFFSALAGVFTVPAVALSAWLMFRKRKIALLSGLIFAVLPFTVFFSRMALVDSLLTFFVVWGFVFSYYAALKLRLDMAMLAGFCFGFAWLTKSTAMFALILLPSLVIMDGILLKKPVQLIKQFSLMLVTFVIAYSMYNILRLGPEFNMIAVRNLDYVFPFSEIIRHPLDPLIPHLKDSVSFFFYLLSPVGLLFAVLGLFIDRLAHWRARVVLAIWWLAPVFAQSFIAKSLTARYLLISVPFAAILMAHAVIHIGDHIKNKLLFYVSAALLLVPCLALDYLYIFTPQSAPLPRIERSGYLEGWTAGYGIKDVASAIAAYSKNGPVLVGSEGFFGTPFDALSAYLNPYSNVRVIGVGVWINTVSDKLTNALGDNQVFLVVNSSRFHGDPSHLGLQLIASYPKAIPPVGEREYLLFFRVLPRK